MLKKCKECEKEISSSASKCPNCGCGNLTTTKKILISIVGTFFACILFITCVGILVENTDKKEPSSKILSENNESTPSKVLSEKEEENIKKIKTATPIDISYNQLLTNEIENHFNLEDMSSVVGYNFVSGTTNDACSSLGIFGNKDNISAISMIISACSEQQFESDLFKIFSIVFNTDKNYWNSQNNINKLASKIDKVVRTRKDQVIIYGNKKISFEAAKLEDTISIIITIKHKDNFSEVE